MYKKLPAFGKTDKQEVFVCKKLGRGFFFLCRLLHQKPVESIGQAEGFLQALYLLQRFFAALVRDVCLFCPEHDVFRGVYRIDDFHNLYPISAVGQQVCPNGIGIKGRRRSCKRP